jgi:hypothetical protein
VDSPGSGWGSLMGCCECGDGPSVSGSMDLVSFGSVDRRPSYPVMQISICMHSFSEAAD